jgi:hypothetical protein
MTYEFNSTLFRTETEMLDRVIQDYMTAFGVNDEEFIQSEFHAHDDEVLADDLQRHWPEVFAEHEAIVEAFSRNRNTFPAWL